MNESLILTPSPEIQMLIQPDITTITTTHSDSQIMLFLRVIWYVFCIYKIISIAFFSKPKPSIRERVLRKFFFAYNEIIRNFTEQERRGMQQIVYNTVSNASVRPQSQTSRLRKSTKKVNFTVQKNHYYEPRSWKEQQQIQFTVIKRPEIHLDQNASFQQKKLEQEFIERQDLLGLDEKSDKLVEEGSRLTQSTQPTIIEESIDHETKKVDGQLL